MKLEISLCSVIDYFDTVEAVIHQLLSEPVGSTRENQPSVLVKRYVVNTCVIDWLYDDVLQ